MNLPTIIEQLYGSFTWSGLYGFEFVNKDDTSITEIFLMLPPKSKSVTENTRSSTVPTLSGNYNLDAGNSTKNITLSGELCAPYVGSPVNPVAMNSAGLPDAIDGLNEFFKLRWMLMRYRDYTMTKNGQMSVPDSVLAFSSGARALYAAIADKLYVKKVGALYDEIRVIFHDYDLDDHWYCRVAKFTSNQTDSKNIAIEYTIEIECTEPFGYYGGAKVTQAKKTSNELSNSINNLFQSVNFSESFSTVQTELGGNTDTVSNLVGIEDILSQVNTENDAIQAGQSTVSTNLPLLSSQLSTAVDIALRDFITLYLTADQQSQYTAGTLTLDTVLDVNLLAFYNTLQKIKLYNTNLQGIINSVVQQPEITFYANANDYVLTQEQFDNASKNAIENTIGFYYYTVVSGDTSRIVALRELHDQNKFTNILQINDITENEFIDGTLVGTEIKIPLLSGGVSRGDDNLVYESNPDNVTQFLYGADIATGLNNNILPSGTGDLTPLSGSDNVVSNLTSRLNNGKGSLNVFNPDWGLTSIGDGNTPLLVRINKYLNDIVGQLQSDPRVKTVQMDLTKLDFVGEVITVPTTVTLIGNESRQVILNG